MSASIRSQQPSRPLAEAGGGGGWEGEGQDVRPPGDAIAVTSGCRTPGSRSRLAWWDPQIEEALSGSRRPSERARISGRCNIT